MPVIADNISLALQGGGAHCAFTWGVIDRLLAEDNINIEAISATSGGAMLAVVMAQGMHDGGHAGARDALQQFWRKVSIASSMLPMRTSIVDKFLSNVGLDITPSSLALDYITRIFSPYQFNLFDLNPLRGIVDEMVDFDMLNDDSPVKLFINATHARTGKSKVFGNHDLSLDAIMASACLPFIFKTVEVDGDPYWDGSFSGCPALTPLIGGSLPSDIVLVQVHPTNVDDVPTTATDILDRATEISFNAVLTQELNQIELRNSIGKSRTEIHRIEAGDMLTSLGRSSKLNTDWEFLLYLRDLGVQAATDWLENARRKPKAAKVS